MFIFYFLFSWNLAASPSVIALAEAEMTSVSVMEGDSVTLNPDLSKIQGMVLLLWRFGEKGSTIAQIDGNYILYEDYEVFRSRLKLDQTGSLTITNVRTNHSGLYKAEVSHNTGTSYIMFRVTVYESPSVIAGTETELKLMSVKEGDPVTLHVPQIQGDELIVWRFGDEGKLIAKADIEAKSSSLYDETERFRDRLKLDQTGSLTITNTRTTDSGEYKVKISSNKQTLYKRFIVTVSGVFGAETGEVKSVMEGDSVTLNPDLTQIQGFIQIQWRFGDPVIAQIDGKEISYPSHTEIFRDRLQLDQTGSLTIRNMRTKHSGLYKLQVDHSTGISLMKFTVTVYESPSVIAGTEAKMKIVSVMEGDPVTFHVPQIQGDELIVWRFGDEGKLIAKADIEAKSLSLYDDTDERFRDRLKLDQTGSLTITNTRTTDSGEYKVKISSNKQTLYKRFTVTVSGVFGAETGEVKSVMEGDSVTLNPDLTQIQGFIQIEWRFGDPVIAQIDGKEISYPSHTEIFRDRLQLDQTGSLTIRNMRTKHSGLYKLQVDHSTGISLMKFTVTVYESPSVIAAGVTELKLMSVKEGDPVTLHVPQIQGDELIVWRFGDEGKLIAKADIETKSSSLYDETDERFRDRLQLDQTGSLTITNTRTTDSGEYKVKISSNKQTLYKRFTVTVNSK
ncbi:uncharacterized protein LOC113071680 [Carassius auratus]|uniref:Uncharacterized protein LOC113071680 n=1 Tax=Carassius auratus TaxID=7957 RepID=A0A6P6MVY8_CARAU|nr:uncharacterized protein LOC113071680 [Carassius auratus]